MNGSKRYNKDGLNSRCFQIYEEEFTEAIQTLKRFVELWDSIQYTKRSGTADLFGYAERDFYYYRFAIGRLEENKPVLLYNILSRVLKEYGIEFEDINSEGKAPFEFVIFDKGARIGFTFKDFDPDKSINTIIDEYNLSFAYILDTTNPDNANILLDRVNDLYKAEKLKIHSITIKDFFYKYINIEEYNAFYYRLNLYLSEAKDVIGYTPLRYLSSINYASMKADEEAILKEWPYKNYKYIIVDNKVYQKFQDLNIEIPSEMLDEMMNRYLSTGLYKAMIGKCDFAASFITSEWLFQELKGKLNFDYTSIISGYLKSVEQLLYAIVLLNVDNNCMITASRNKSTLKKIRRQNIIVYEPSDDGLFLPVTPNGKNYQYIELTSSQINYIDKSIGTYEKFLQLNPHIFCNAEMADITANLISCFRNEYRNGYFHRHNLYDWNLVECTRDNAIYIYFAILGGCVVPPQKMGQLGIAKQDEFDELCRRIRNFGFHDALFVVENYDGERNLLFYDSQSNPAEYSNDGLEHYESLLFVKLKEFSEEAFLELAEGITEEQKFYLTRDNYKDIKIYGINTESEMVEI